MTDERIRELAEGSMYLVLGDNLPRDPVERAIRLALAERDREVAEWAKANEQQHDWIEGLEYVLVSDLAAFLEAGT